MYDYLSGTDNIQSNSLPTHVHNVPTRSLRAEILRPTTLILSTHVSNLLIDIIRSSLYVIRTIC